MESDEDLLGELQEKDDYQELDDLDADEENALLGDSDEEGGNRTAGNASEQYEFVDEDGNPVEVGENEDVEFIQVAQENSREQFDETGTDDILDLAVETDLEFDDSSALYENPDQPKLEHSSQNDSRQQNQTPKQIRLKRQPSLTGSSSSSSQAQFNQSNDGHASQSVRSIAVTVQQNVRDNYNPDNGEAEQESGVENFEDHDFQVNRTVLQEQDAHNYSRDSDESEDEEESGRGRFRTERTNIIQLSNRRSRTNLPDSLDSVFPYDESDRGNRGGRRQNRPFGYGERNRGGGGNRDRSTRGRNDHRDRNQGVRERDERDRRKERSDDTFKSPSYNLPQDSASRRDNFLEPTGNHSRQSGGNRTNAIPSLLDNNFEPPGMTHGPPRNSEQVGGRKILINPHFKGPVASDGSDVEASPYGNVAGGSDPSGHTGRTQFIPPIVPVSHSTGLLATPSPARRQHPASIPPIYDQMQGSHPAAQYHSERQSHHGMSEFHHGQAPQLLQPPPNHQHQHQHQHLQQHQQQQPPHNMPGSFGGAPPMQLPSFPPPRGRQAPPPSNQSNWPPPGNFFGGNKVPPHDMRIPPPMSQFQDNQFSRPPPQPNFNQLNLPNGPPPPINNRPWDARIPAAANQPPPLFANPPDLRPPSYTGMQQPPPNIMGGEQVQRLVQFNSPPPNFQAPPPIRVQQTSSWADQSSQPILVANLPQMNFNQPPPMPHMHQQISQSIPSVSGIKPFGRSDRPQDNNFRQAPRVSDGDQRNQQWLKAVEDFNKSQLHHKANFPKRAADNPVFNTSPKQMKMTHSTPKNPNWRTPTGSHSNTNIKEIVLVDTLPAPKQPVIPIEEEDEETRRYREQIELQKKKREQILREKEQRRVMMAEQRRRNLMQQDQSPKTNEPVQDQSQRSFNNRVAQQNQPTWNTPRQMIDNSNQDAGLGATPVMTAGFDSGGQRRKVFVRKVLTSNANTTAQLPSPQAVRSLVELPTVSSHRNMDQMTGSGNQNQRQQPEHLITTRQPVKRMAMQNIEVCVQKTPLRQLGHGNQQPNCIEPFQQQQQQSRGGGPGHFQRPPAPHQQQQQRHQSPGSFTMSSQYRPAGPDHQLMDRFPSPGPQQMVRNQSQNAAPRGRIIQRMGPRPGQFQSGVPRNNFAGPSTTQQQQSPPPNVNRPLRQLMSTDTSMPNQRPQQQQPFRGQRPREFGSNAGSNRVVLMPQDLANQQQARPQPVLRMPFVGESPTAIKPQQVTQGQRVITNSANRQRPVVRSQPTSAGAVNQKIVISNRQSLAVGQQLTSSAPANKIVLTGKQEGNQRKVIVNSQPQLRKIAPPSSEPSSVRIENLAVATSDAQIRKICETIGAVENITKDNRTAVVKFKDHAHAKLFMNRYQRRMVDLSLISISLST